jgi:hypothetical protein
VRLSPTRVLVRVALLTLGGVFMLARAWEAHRAARLVGDSGALLASRVAVVWALVGVLALVTAVGSALALRRRRRRATLHLGGDRPARRQ